MKLEDIAYQMSSSKTKPNVMMKRNVVPFFKEQGVRKVLDYGCGRFLRDSLYLTEQGMIVDAVDIGEQVKMVDPEKSRMINNLSDRILGDNYDAALLNFVIQVLPTEKQRKEVLRKVYDSIREDGYLVLSLRNMRDIRRYVEARGTPFKDGYLMTGKSYCTFVRGYERKEIEEIISSLDMELIKMFRSSVSFVALSQKKSGAGEI